MRTANESTSPLQGFLRRLALLGATDDEIADVAATWDTFDTDWTPERRAELISWPDDRIREELLATRDEWQYGTTTEDETDQQAAARLATTTAREAQEIIGRPVAVVLEWVGTDALRAIAALDLELGPDGAERKTLVEPLRAMLEPDAAPA
jgi:hypothetical protein